VSGKTTPASSSREAEMSGVALSRAKAQARSSSEAKAKAPCGASTAQPRSGANIASLKAPAQCYTSSFASSNKAKVLCANLASPCEAKSHSEAILASLETKKKAFKAKPRIFQPKRATIQSPQGLRIGLVGSS